MYNYRLTIQYDGGRYKGWQRLGSGENTIQEKIEHVVSEMTGKPTEITGCSRTDAGVHALEQIANFKTEIPFSNTQIQDYLNRYLPQDISIRSVKEVPEQFHARYHAKDKTYLYKIWNREYSNPFMRKYSMQVKEVLNVTAMKQAALFFIGEHDFTAFSNAKSKKKSMIKEIYSIDIREQEGFIDIRIRGNGFLYNMVRWMVGTLIEAGLGNIKPADVTDIIESRERNRTGNLAEAGGLYLEKVSY